MMTNYSKYEQMAKEKLEILTIKEKAHLMKAFNNYLEKGGFPLIIKENDTELLNIYYNDIFYRDIIARHNIQNVQEIKELSTYLMSNSGKITTYNKLAEISNIKSTSLINKYLDYFEKAYLFEQLKKFDYSIKKQILNPRKIYACDTGMMKETGFNFSENKGRLLETMVYVELKRRKKEIYYHKEKKECDFVIFEKGNITEAIQVTWELHDNNKKREIEGLLEAMKKYELKEGSLMTYDQEEELTVEGKKIVVKPVWKWLLE